jgi:hypothetical protein
MLCYLVRLPLLLLPRPPCLAFPLTRSRPGLAQRPRSSSARRDRVGVESRVWAVRTEIVARSMDFAAIRLHIVFLLEVASLALGPASNVYVM